MNTKEVFSLKSASVACVIAALALCLSGLFAPGLAQAASYADCQNDQWYSTYVNWASDEGVMSGYTDGSNRFGPYDSMTRGQAACILYRYATGATAATTDNNISTVFPDVVSGSYYTAAVKWANDEGIITGYSDTGTFGPDDAVTREQFAAMLYRYMDSKDCLMDADNKTFNALQETSNTSDWAHDAMVWVCDRHIVEGIDNTRLAPQDSIWRASAAKMLKLMPTKVLKTLTTESYVVDQAAYDEQVMISKGEPRYYYACPICGAKYYEDEWYPQRINEVQWTVDAYSMSAECFWGSHYAEYTFHEDYHGICSAAEKAHDATIAVAQQKPVYDGPKWPNEGWEEAYHAWQNTDAVQQNAIRYKEAWTKEAELGMLYHEMTHDKESYYREHNRQADYPDATYETVHHDEVGHTQTITKYIYA